MNQELKDLISAALADGVITQKERDVIYKKASNLGADTDEVDIFIEAALTKISKEKASKNQEKKGYTCPFCGAPIPQLADKCPDCGSLITAKVSKELEELINDLEQTFHDIKLGRDINNNMSLYDNKRRKALLYFGNNPKIKNLLAEYDSELSHSAKSLKTKSYLKSPWTWLALSFIFLFIDAIAPWASWLSNTATYLFYTCLFPFLFFLMVRIKERISKQIHNVYGKSN